MILKPYQLEKYNAIMAERINEISKEDHVIHGYMIYQCEHCNNSYVMWLEKGLEDPTDEQKTGRHKPVPFGIICPTCGGTAYHIWLPFERYGLGKGYKSYQKYVDKLARPICRNFFWNDPTSDCGVPVIFEPDCHEGIKKLYKYDDQKAVNILQEYYEYEIEKLKNNNHLNKNNLIRGGIK